MTGLALEGGGARGAYHIGVVKAFLENGYKFDGVVGTSIGALNATLIAQGDFEQLDELWESLTMSEIFSKEAEQILVRSALKFNRKGLGVIKTGVSKFIKGGGIDTSKMKTVIDQYLDENKLRNSKKDFGLVTVCLNDMKACEMYLQDIPKGQVLNYVMASASFPGFVPEIIDGKHFVDGGFYNNCPINMLLNKGYDRIIAVRTFGPGNYLKVPENKANITIIEPSRDLGSILLFDHDQIETNINMGYYDALRSIKKLKGMSYYIDETDIGNAASRLMNMAESDILKVADVLKFPDMPSNRMLFELIIPRIATYLKLNNEYEYSDFILALLEHEAERRKIGRYKVYKYNQFLDAIRENHVKTEKRSILSNVLHSKEETATDLMAKYILNGKL